MANFNGTLLFDKNHSITLTDSSSHHFNWPVLILSIAAVFGTFGNLLVCASISLDKQLQTVTNWFLFSLAIADCLVSVVVLPLSIIKDFQGSWQLPILVCNLYVFLDVLLCTTSIWHLTIVSIDRFLYISRPFRSRERSKFKTFLIIVMIWTFSIVISCAILILGFTDQTNILVPIDEHRRYCTLNNRSFIIYGSIICFCVPCILMIVSYSLTIRRLQKQAAKCYSDPDDHLEMVTHSVSRIRRHRSQSKLRTLSSTSPRNISIRDLSSIASLPTPSSINLMEMTNPSEWTNPSMSSSSSARSFLHNTLVQKAVHVLKGDTETTSERRAMKVLGIVFFVFLVAWMPFSILNILLAVWPSFGVQRSLLNLTSWFGYISSNLNPIIYTAFNVRFRRAFVSILTCQFNYFSHKRKGNNFYIFIASNSNHPNLSMDRAHRYFFPARRFLSKRNSFA